MISQSISQGVLAALLLTVFIGIMWQFVFKNPNGFLYTGILTFGLLTLCVCWHFEKDTGFMSRGFSYAFGPSAIASAETPVRNDHNGRAHQTSHAESSRGDRPSPNSLSRLIKRETSPGGEMQGGWRKR